MFSEEDLLSYFAQLQGIEQKMHDTYQGLHDRLTHQRYKNAFGRMAREEKTHWMMIEDLKDLIRRAGVS